MLRRPRPERNKCVLRARRRHESHRRERVRLRLQYASNAEGRLLLVVETPGRARSEPGAAEATAQVVGRLRKRRNSGQLHHNPSHSSSAWRRSANGRIFGPRLLGPVVERVVVSGAYRPTLRRAFALLTLRALRYRTSHRNRSVYVPCATLRRRRSPADAVGGERSGRVRLIEAGPSATKHRSPPLPHARGHHPTPQRTQSDGPALF